MCGIKKDVFNKILSENPKSLFTNCFENSVGIYNVDNIKVDALVTVIKDILIRLNALLSNTRG